MMRIYKLAIIFGIFSFCLLPFRGLALAYPTAKITAKVVGEKENIIQGADVHISFEIAKKGGWGTDNFGKEGVSDSDGLFTAKANASSRIGITVRKEGYYFSRQIYEFPSRSLLLNRWEPWNPTIEVVLKKKRNPVAMYIGGTNWVEVPALEKPVGYDLEKGDWVAPYGGGFVSDITIEFNLSYRAYTDYDANMTISFPNGQDGIQEYWFDNNDQSYFKWPFQAPVDGYKQSVNIFEKDTPDDGYKTNKKEGVNYIFRIRTKLDKEGNIISANYGKFIGEFGISRKGKTRFSYILNLDGTRNLEEDPEKNLFKKK
jgi:hypothetical protein